MTKLTESAIEDFAIKLFECLSYDYIHASNLASIWLPARHVIARH
ncbi:MAG: hypothetical protein WAQ56_08485 [Candidatus Nitrotoga sp.]